MINGAQPLNDSSKKNATAKQHEQHATLIAMGLVGNSGAIHRLRETILQYADARAPVLVMGETGTGKEVVARALHYLSDRAGQPFVPINCGSLVETLFEKEFFGSERGAFTDARARYPGYVEQAGQGTLFMDEVNSLGAKAQSSLLRFLQDQTYRPVGSLEQKKAEVRILAASNQPLETLCKDREFRTDLMYRLNVLQFTLPALRDRPDDIGLLLERHSHQLNDLYGRIKGLSAELVAWAREQAWPGNVRELQNWLHRRYLQTPGDLIYPEHSAPPVPAVGLSGAEVAIFQVAKQQAVRRFERHYLSEVLKISEGNISQAARLAGKERRSFGRLLKKHGLQPSQFKP